MAPSSIVHQTNEDRTHSSMMAWRVHEFGPPNVMRFEQVPRPSPGVGEVLVKVEAVVSNEPNVGSETQRMRALYPGNVVNKVVNRCDAAVAASERLNGVETPETDRC